jgi:hypothetical protein
MAESGGAGTDKAADGGGRVKHLGNMTDEELRAEYGNLVDWADECLWLLARPGAILMPEIGQIRGFRFVEEDNATQEDQP